MSTRGRKKKTTRRAPTPSPHREAPRKGAEQDADHHQQQHPVDDIATATAAAAATTERVAPAAANATPTDNTHHGMAAIVEQLAAFQAQQAAMHAALLSMCETFGNRMGEMQQQQLQQLRNGPAGHTRGGTTARHDSQRSPPQSDENKNSAGCTHQARGPDPVPPAATTSGRWDTHGDISVPGPAGHTRGGTTARRDSQRSPPQSDENKNSAGCTRQARGPDPVGPAATTSGRRQTLVDITTLTQTVAPYTVKYKSATRKLRGSLAPATAQTVVDDIVRTTLAAVQPGRCILPWTHEDLPDPDADKINRTYLAARTRAHQLFNTIIDRHWQDATGQATFLDRHTVAQCIKGARQAQFTNPIFLGQTLLETLSTHRATTALWRRIKHRYTSRVTGWIGTAAGEPIHILDLYQRACTQRVSTTSAQNAAKSFDKYEQRASSAATYVTTKLERLREVLSLYDVSNSDNPENRFVVSAVTTALASIQNHAGTALRTHMALDAASAAPTLPWSRPHTYDHDGLAHAVHEFADTMTEFARRVDEAVELQLSMNNHTSSCSPAKPNKSTTTTTPNSDSVDAGTDHHGGHRNGDGGAPATTT